jgi:hypothetical protein
MIEAFPESTALRYMIRDRDKVEGDSFRRRVMAMSIRELMSLEIAGNPLGWRG